MSLPPNTRSRNFAFNLLDLSVSQLETWSKTIEVQTRPRGDTCLCTLRYLRPDDLVELIELQEKVVSWLPNPALFSSSFGGAPHGDSRGARLQPRAPLLTANSLLMALLSFPSDSKKIRVGPLASMVPIWISSASWKEPSSRLFSAAIILRAASRKCDFVEP